MLPLGATGCVATVVIPGGRLQLAQEQTFPAVKLRGYGTLSGSAWKASTAGASILQVNCDNEAMAMLVVAKYLSDFGLLPGITTLTLTTKIGSLTGCQAAGQGAVAALRSGSQAFIDEQPIPPTRAAFANR